MKSIKHSICTAAVATLGALSLASCTDGNDWDVDNTLNRLFGTTDISLDIHDTKVGVAFTEIKGAEGYQVELSTDSLYADEVAPGSIVDTLRGTPDTLRNLTGETKYYLRMRSIAQGKAASRWVYYKNSRGHRYFVTKSEQLFRDLTPADVDESTAHVSWRAGQQVTHLVVLKGGETVKSIELGADPIAAGDYTITGLQPTTTYTVNLMNGTAKRGTLTLTTTAAMPAASYKYYLPAGTKELTQDMLDQIAATAQQKAGSNTNYSVTIGIAAGQQLTLYGSNAEEGKTSLTIPDGMAVTFFGLAGDAPTLKLQKALNLEGSHAYVRFQHLNITDDGAGYFVNQSKTATVDEFGVDNCEVSDFATAFFRLQGTSGITVNTLSLNNSIFHDMCSGYSFIHVDAGSGKGKVNRIRMANCTLYNIATGGKMLIFSKKTNMESIAIDRLTMYNCIGNGNFLIDFGDKTFGANSITISNSLFAKTPDDVTNKNLRCLHAPVVTNTYTPSDFFKKIDGATALDAAADDVFADPAAGNFTLKPAYTRLGAGDSRWDTID